MRVVDAERWFRACGWSPFDFQREVWAAMTAGESGLLHATTGSGKTYAVWIGALLRAAALCRLLAGQGAPPLGVLWITPMKALATDTTRAVELPLAALAPSWSVGRRTGDTASAERARQDKRLPTALVTTPESLSLLLTRENALRELAGVHTVIVDEWHELIGNKRGVQVQLALARLKRWNPSLVIWGLSATLARLDAAMATLCGTPARLVQGRIDKALVIDTLLPHEPGRFCWGGHLGAQMQQPVVEEIERTALQGGGSTLVFTNVRSQAEIWYQLLLAARPDWAGQIALHHGSLDKGVREWVEAGLKDGSLRAVVATSSLDLGVDFLPVERVLQIGSAKGVARLLQRAGRSGHAPGRASRVTLVPTNTLELVEAAAARRAALAGEVESRESPSKPLDVLVQHLVTVALGGDLDLEGQPRHGFDADELFGEVRAAFAYRELTRDEFDWALAFVEHGGASLDAYPQYHRVVHGDDGRYRVTDRGIAQRHRLQIGTIVSDAAMQVAWLSGGRLGSIEEGFIARLKPGDCFVFSGRVLEYIRTREMTAYVKRANKNKGIVPAWSGTKMALSEAMTDSMLELLHGAAQGDFFEPEMQAAQPMLAAQERLSRLPRRGVLLIERFQSAEGHHLFLYPFGGRNVHVGLAQLLAWRLSRAQPNTFSLSINDFGLELLSVQAVDPAPLLDGSVFGIRQLLPDVLASLNSGELAQRRFREISRVAGLVFGGFPGAPKSVKQLQASSGLFWQVFRKYDAGNRLLTQAENEVLAQELDVSRLAATLHRMAAQRVEWVELRVPSPFALPLMVERFREELSTEKLADRLARILAEADAELAKPASVPGRRRK
jgi:ATP-dependent helicase Lhr and Lhr-like helicase